MSADANPVLVGSNEKRRLSDEAHAELNAAC